MSTLRPLSLAATFACLLAGPVFAHDGVHILDAYARFIPGARAGGAFMVIENHATVDERLLSVTADVAGMTELHRSEKKADGTMGMAPVDGGLAIAPGTSVELMPGGDHIMMMDLKGHPKDGDTIHLTLEFSHAGKVELDVPVQNRR